jgi:HNH endonuclease.
MEKSIKYDGYTWTKKPRGYYQSTVRCTDGSRKNWLHQYVYEQVNGSIPEGYEVHHKDHNKENNDISNLELLSPAEHQAEHTEQSKANGYKLADYVAANFDEVQALAKKGKSGEYIGKNKRRKIPNQPIKCVCCATEFTPSNKARKDTKFCSNSCRDEWHGAHAKECECKECGAVFKPSSRSARYCSDDCRSANAKRAVKREFEHICCMCGEAFTGTKGQTCCGEKCARDRKNELKRMYRQNKKNLGN